MSGKRGVRKIVLDEITQKFLSELRQERKRLNIRGKYAAEYCGCCERVLLQYEIGRACPSLEVLMKLSELYGYDLSESFNYKYYHRRIAPSEIYRLRKRYGLSYEELSRLTGYGCSTVHRASTTVYGVSLECVYAVLCILEREKESERIRRKVCRKR
ncbi:MAG: helix-turn-helix domain-containing protein [Synergistaceae bacterium]|nr:helix-turn-helix domain-containing protein [Synergistaceae bacterium]MBQ9629094.1 helix-turn-helix domain-containing protein [Synergistaceae bacterium]MBR0250917.1 helix-turn-helix domain-containing protein [Synergistaceae bacterium]